MHAVAIVPAYQNCHSVGRVIADLIRTWPQSLGNPAVLVVDDGSSDGTDRAAERAGATVIRHERNRGKGAALKTGLFRAHSLGAKVAVTVDADGQHPAAEAMRLLAHSAPEHALVLGVRDLVRDGAPRANRFSNGFSNLFLSLFSRRRLADTQCGLRRYPVAQTLALDPRETGYGFEAEVILRAARAGWPIEQVPVRVIYPPRHERVSHFHVVRDPARIVLRVLHTFATAPGRR
jgi:glycosyltransferase involved in cell wall biosynthesis